MFNKNLSIMIKKFYLFIPLLTAFLWLGTGRAWGDELTVSDGTKQNEYHPVYGYYCDDATHHNQVLYSTSEFSALAGMNGKQITKLTFYSSSASVNWGAKFNVGLAEVAETSLSGFNSATLTQVCTNAALKIVNSQMIIEFDEPYAYNGGNLLLDIKIATKGSYIKASFFGIGTYDYVYSYKTDGNGSKSSYYVPKTTFTYETPASGPALSVYDGSAKLASGANCSLGLATEGTTKTFTLKNPGTAATPISVAHTGSFGVSLSAASIPAGEEITLTVTMPAASGSDVVTISSTAEGVDDFVINVSGTAKDPTRVFETLLDGSKPTDWTTSGTWYWDGTKGAYNFAYYETSNYRIITPLLTVAEGEIFYFDAKGTYDGYQGVKFEYSTDGTTWTASNTATTLSDDWQTFMINDIPAGKYYIALHGWQVQLRNYYGGYIPAAPKDIVLTDKTSTSLTLNWTPAGSETSWVLQYSTDNTTWSDDIPVGSKPFELTGLNPSTKYYVRVRATESTEWSASADFRAECGAISTLPWNCGFEDDAASAAPACWQLITYYDDWDAVYYPYVAATNAYAGSKALAFSGGGSATTSPIAILPQFSNNISSLVLSFYYKASEYGSYANLKVGYITDPADASTFVPVETLDQTSAYTPVGPFAFAGAPAGAYMAIQYAGGTSDYGAAYVDNITVEEAPSCMQPGKPAAAQADITANSAIVTWAAGGSESAWKLQYKAANGDWSNDIAVSAASYTLTNLSPVTTYYVRVKAVCGEQEVSEWSAEGDFTTECGTVNIPFEESFSSSSALPSCWNAPTPTSTTYRWKANSEYVGGAYNYIISLRGSSNSAELSTPSIALSEDAVLKFRWKNGSTTKITANVYISIDGGATRELLPNDLSTKVTSWTNKTIDLSDYTGETVIIYFVSATGNSASSYAYLDDVQVIAKPCEGPTGLAAAPTIDGGTISWIGSAKALRYKTGDAEWTKIAVSGNSKTLTGLQAETAYQVQVQAACAASDDEAWSASLSFTTKCAASSVLSYENNFENEALNEIPTCWDRISANAYPQVVSGAAAYGGSGKALYFYGNTNQTAVLPAFTQALNTLSISFYYKGGSANFQLGYVKADGVTFVALETLPALTAFGAEPYELDLASIPAEAKYLAIRYSSTSNYASGYVDNVVVRKTPTCFKPASAEVESYTDNSAVINWTASGKGETQYQYVCVPANTNPDWDEATLTDQLTATVENLAAQKAYDFYVRSYCGDEQSDAVKVSFTTACSVISALPWEYDFEDDDTWGYPECWNKFEHGFSGAYVVDNSGKAAPQSLYVLGGTTDSYATVILPKFAAALNTLAISFQYSGSEGDAYGKMKVGYMTNIENESSFVVVKEFAPADAYKQAVVSFAGISADANIAIQYVGGSSEGDLYIDDIRVARTEVFNDFEENQDRFAALKEEGTTIDVLFNRTLLGNGDYNTFCLPFNLNADQLEGSPIANFKLKAYDFATIENEELLIAIAPASSIKAGVPYFIANNENEANLTEQLFKDVVIAADAPSNVPNGDVTFQGVFNPVDLAAQTAAEAHTQLFLAAGNMIYWPAQNKTVKGFRAYFEVNVASGVLRIQKGMPVRIVEHTDNTTGIEDVQGNVQSVKMLENKQVVIIRNGVKYNVQGQVISK